MITCQLVWAMYWTWAAMMGVEPPGWLVRRGVSLVSTQMRPLSPVVVNATLTLNLFMPLLTNCHLATIV